MRRLAAAALLAGLWLLATGPAAGAHGNLRASQPADGSALTQPPQAVRLEFSEAPERALSAVHVLDASGRPVERGRVQPVPGQPRALSVPLDALGSGVYTVSWRVVSRVDGHTTRGVFAFGVGDQAPGTIIGVEPAAVRQSGDPPTGLGVAGRWAVYWGFALLIGAAATGLAVFDRRLPGRPARLLVTALLLAAAGLVLMAVAAATAAEVSLVRLAGSATGLWLLGRGAALLVAAWAVALLLTRPSPARHLARPGPLASARPLAVLALAAAGGLLVHTLAGHAAAPSPLRGLNLLAQWAHLVAVGVWIGGLAWLLQGLRGQSRAEQVTASVRFSRLAAAGLVVVVATGVARTLDELGGWQRLADSGYGRALLVKVVVFAALAGMGAGNRYLVIPALRAGQIPVARLRGTVRGELGLAAVVLAVAALLSELPPGATPAPASQAPAAPTTVQASGSDYATSLRVTLTVTPGVAGPNRFAARVADYDTGAPLPVQRLRLSSALRSRPDLEASSLDLARDGDGRWHGQGNLLSIAGRWDVTALVETGSRVLTVPLDVEMGLPGAPSPPRR
ncbi:MAG TPA: copper resistance protein CopC [Actinomycetes bacterium]|jgi:copper transport protein|nr:copper resistance protein CopC [Actinomycetes bacterium]